MMETLNLNINYVDMIRQFYKAFVCFRMVFQLMMDLIYIQGTYFQVHYRIYI
jgi:hypothetical protein